MKNYILLLLLCISFSKAQSIEGLNFRLLDVKDGVSHNFVNGILRDSYGFMWFATVNGLSRYDGYNFKSYTTTQLGAYNNDIYYLEEDGAGNIWIKAAEKYYFYNREKDDIDKDIQSILQPLGINGEINKLFVDHDHNLWCTNSNGLFNYNYSSNNIYQFDLDGKEVKWLDSRNGYSYILFTNGEIGKIDFETNNIQHETSINLSSYPHHKMYIDHAFNLWFYTAHSPEDILQYYNPQTKKWKKFTDKKEHVFDFVTSVIDDGKGNIWIGTDDSGITIYHTITNKFSHIKYEKGNPFSIPTNHIKCFYKDEQDIMWVGTSKRGIAYTRLNNIGFKLYTLPEQDDISCILQDKQNNLWLGSDGEGLTRLGEANNDYKYFNEKDGSICKNLIVCSFLDSKNRVWFGTYGGGVCYFENGKFTNVNSFIDNGVDVTLQYIRSIDEDVAGNIWIGTMDKGLYCYDAEGQFKAYTTENFPLHSNSITDLYCNYGQNLYIGTSAGLSVMNTYTRQISRLEGTKDGNILLADDYINSLYRDTRGLLWIGGREGISIFDEVQDTIIFLNTENGLSHNYIRAIVEDKNKNIWVTTDLGITNIVVVNDPLSRIPAFRCYRYYDEDGLGNIAFNNHSIWCNEKGEVLMGGMGGYIKAFPGEVQYNHFKSKVIFTGLHIANKLVNVNEPLNDGRIILHKNIQLLNEIFLDYSDNNFALDVSSMDYESRRKTMFAFRLGEDAEWIKLPGNVIHFNQLPVGTYTLQVKASNNDGHWSNTPSSLIIHIKPPFWLSLPAYFFYVLVALSIIILTVIRRRKKNQFKLQMQKFELDRTKQQEMDEAKLRFFTNVSHDLRTPLSLIITPLEKLISSSTSDDDTKEELELMYRNAVLLMGEVNQLLDLRKLDNKKSELHLSHGDLPEFIKEVCSSFTTYSNKKRIEIKLLLKSSSIEMDFDKNKLQRTFMNLLSNAFKFNVDNGSITVTVDRILSSEGELARVQIADTGIGIRDENKELIFERFYQETQASAFIGSGIGLHIVREYVTMHGGEVQVKDNIPQGSVFIVTLPITGIQERYIQEEPEEEAIQSEEAESIPAEYPILIVEDNDDFRQFLINCLKDNYKIISAPHGKKALALMAQQPVQMVISDVMMPVMNGLELCNKIKSDIRFSHIPIILLTARTADEHILNGLKEGADDYITKPFNLEILLLRIRKLLEWGHNNHKKFKVMDVEPSEITISSLDEQLIGKAINLVEENMDNPDFSVEDLSVSIGMTRGHLYKKLMMITGKSPIEFMRVLRIKRGKQLLEKSQLSVSEIAYKIGLSPKQFSKHFKDAYGELPSAFKKKEEDK